jgi:uncharacterized protein (TIGR00369 family)
MSDEEETIEPAVAAAAAGVNRGPNGPPIPLHLLLGLEMVPGEDGTGKAEVRMPVRPEAFGSHGNLHGGGIATMVDLTCALAAVRAHAFDLETQSLVTTDLHVRYMGQPRTDWVVAHAKVVRAGASIVVVECKVADEGGHVIATADVGMMIVVRRRPVGS